MFLVLLIVTLVVALAVSLRFARAFTQPIDNILRRIIADEIGSAWLRRNVREWTTVVGDAASTPVRPGAKP